MRDITSVKKIKITTKTKSKGEKVGYYRRDYRLDLHSVFAHVLVRPHVSLLFLFSLASIKPLSAAMTICFELGVLGFVFSAFFDVLVRFATTYTSLRYLYPCSLVYSILINGI